MRKRSLIVWLIMLLLLAVAIASCLPWQEPPEGQLVYTGPTEQGIPAGYYLPGTDIQYLGLSGESAELLIGGQRAEKKKGDSLDWDGHPMEGVTLNLKQRVVWFGEETLHAAGTARLAIEDTQPVAARFPDEPPATFKLPTTYNVKQGEIIPGTTISYAGETDDGAELAGVEGYPYRKIADSISWEGQLRQGVFLKLGLRVAFFNEKQLQVVGLATVALVP